MKKRLLPALILITYCIVLIRIMVFKVVPIIKAGQVTLDFGGVNGGHPANFVPLATIVPYLLGSNGLTIAFLNLVGNIALLVPLGFLVPFVFTNINWKKALTLGAVAGLLIEIMQTVLNVGIFDIDDVILNTLGVMMGYVTFILLTKWLRERKYIHILIAALLVVAAAAASFYVMYPHDAQEGAVPQSGDLCGGTGGTGQIVSMGNNTITIKGKNGIAQTIILTAQTEIRALAGTISESDLKIGDHVTVVIMDESKNATTVLVCSVPIVKF
jgi:glycopeptide antibiotics resistance protein